MLKLTHSLSRYFNSACSSYNQLHVSKFSHFTATSEVFCVYTAPSALFSGHFSHSSHWLKSLPTLKKKSQPSKLFNKSNESKYKSSKNMSDSVQPTLNHVSYGGQFDISESGNPIGNWRKKDEGQSSQSGIYADNINPIENWRKRDEGQSSQQRNIIPPDFRAWESVGKKSDGKSFRFRIVSYNVLAQYLLECHPYLYTECSPHNLKWKNRAPKLYDEIIALAPDIICLQEVQASHLDSFYNKFEDIGYSGIYKQKTGDRMDGCAIYFNQSLFELQDQISVEFYQPDLPILNRDNIGIIVKLVPRTPPRTPIVVATTHLLYNPKRTDVRLAQMQVFLAEIDRFAYYDNGRGETGYLPIILSGDFNSTPETAVIKLLDRGCVSTNSFRDSSDWTKIEITDGCQHLRVYLDRLQGKQTDFCDVKIHHSDLHPTTEDESFSEPSAMQQTSSSFHNDTHGKFNTGYLYHNLKLKSVYPKVKPNGHLEATTFQDYWITVDYIYYSNLRVVERLRLPTANECDVLGTLPNELYGSDHLALAAGFELTQIKHML